MTDRGPPRRTARRRALDLGVARSGGSRAPRRRASPDGHAGIERAVRILEDDLHPAAERAQRRPRRGRARRSRRTAPSRAAGVEPQDGAAHGGLPEPDSPTSPSVSPAAIEAHAVDGVDGAGPPGKPPPVVVARHQVADLEQRRRHRLLPDRASSAPPRRERARPPAASRRCTAPALRGSGDESGSRWAMHRGPGPRRESACKRSTRRVDAGDRAEQRAGVGMGRRANSRAWPPSPTIWPAYITATRSARPATRPRSWAISSTAMPRSRRSRSSSSRI